jgi:hypothetical protein
MARVTGLEPATSGVTGRHSNQLSYTRTFLQKLSSLTMQPRLLGWPLPKRFHGRCQASLKTK